jgi:hypothetical protein
MDKRLEFSSSNWPVTVLQIPVQWPGSVPAFQIDHLSPHSELFKCAFVQVMVHRPIPVAARSKASVWATSLLGLHVRILPVAWKSVSFQYCVLSLIQSSPTKCVLVTECDQVQQKPSIPTISRQTEVRIMGKKKNERLNFNSVNTSVPTISNYSSNPCIITKLLIFRPTNAHKLIKITIKLFFFFFTILCPTMKGQ